MIVSGLQSGSSFVSDVSKWITQLFLFVNSLVSLPSSGVG